MKRILALLLALVTLVGAVPVTHATEVEVPPAVTEPTEETEPAAEETEPVTEAAEPATEPVPDAQAQTVDLDSGYIGDLYWNVTGEGVLTITGSGEIPDFDDPYDWDSEYPAPWYSYGQSITALSLSEGITRIGAYAFPDLAVRSVMIPDSVTELGAYAFCNCSELEEVQLPDSITQIPYACFFGTAINTLDLPDSLTTICTDAFGYSALEHLEIPENVTYIQDSAFHHSSLHTVKFLGHAPELVEYDEQEYHNGTFGYVTATVLYPGNDPSWDTVVDKDYGGNLTWEAYEKEEAPDDGMIVSGTIGELTWRIGDDYVLEIIGSGEIPDYTSHEETPWAAYAENITGLQLDKGITYIGSYAFSMLGIGSVVIPDSVTAMGEYAFYNCTNLSRVQLGSGLKAIPMRCFRWCGLTSVAIPANITRLEESAFDYNFSLTEVKLHDTITYIGPKAFWNDPIVSIDLPAELTAISYGAFSDTALTGITIPEKVTVIEDFAFGNTPLETAELPASLKTIGDGAFSNTALTEIVLPAGLESMGNCVFQYFETAKLQTVRFLGEAPAFVEPDAEKGLDGTFAYVTARVLYPDSAATWEAAKDKNYGGNLTWESYFVPAQTVTDYTYTAQDGQVTITGYLGNDTEITVPAAIDRMPVTALADGAFSDRAEITKVTLPQTITSIGSDAFAWCYQLEEVVLPDNLTSIGCGAFQNCEQLKEVRIPAGVTWIENDTFLNCYQLEKVTLPDGLLYIGDYAFGYCEKLTDITIPASVTHIGNYAFRGCKAITGISLPAGLTEISEGAFSLCQGMTRIVIPKGVTVIGTEAFFGNKRMGSVTLPVSVRTVEKQAFSQCNDLRCISYGGTAAQKDAISIASGNTDLKNANWHLDGTYCKVILTSVTAHASGKPELTWPDYGCMQSYEVYRSTSSKGTYTLLDTVTGTGYVDESAQLGKKYYYCLVGINNESEATEKTASKSGYCRLAQPVITADNPNRIPVISWEKVEKATKYEIWRAETAHDTFKKVTTTSKLTYTDTKAPKGELSYYKVRALGSGSNITSNYSNIEGTGYVVAGPKLKLTLTSGGMPSLSWDKVTGANFYDVYRGLSEEGPFEMVKSQKKTNFLDEKAPADTTCYYYVVAVAPGDGCSGVSEVRNIATACPTPTLTSVTADNAAGLPVISWKAVEGAASYEVSRATKSSGTYTPVGTTEELSFTDETAEGGRTWYYKVTAITHKGTRSKPSAYKSGKCICAAPEIRGVSVEIASGKPFLSWDAVSGAKKYEVYRATSENGKYTKVSTVSKATSGSWYTYADTKASVGKTYFYKVKSIASSSSYNSAYSKIISGLCYCAQPKVKAAVHAATGQPELSWSKVSGAVKYEILRAVSEDGPYTRVRTQSDTAYRDTAAVTDTAYFYKVNALASRESCNSLDGAPVSVTAACAQPVITGAESHAFLGYPILSWKAVEHAAVYEISRAAKSSGSYEIIGTATELTFSDKTAAGGKTWYYKVTALTESGARSAASSYKSAKSICAKPVVVMGVSPEGKPTLEWEAVSGAKKYEIYRTVNPTGKYTKITTTSKLSFVDAKAPAAAACYYKVRALASSSSYNSIYAEYLIAPSLCARPKLTVKLNTKTGKPELSWKKVTGAIGYKILRAMGDGEYQALAEVTGTSYKDTVAPVDTVISYKLIALAKESIYDSYESDPKSVTIAVGKPTIATAAADETTGKPRLTWEPVEGAVSYEILRSSKSKSGYTAIGTTVDLTYVDTTAAVGKTYYYKLAALGNNTRSAESGYKSVKCSMDPPVITVQLSNLNNAVIRWETVTNAAKYEIYRAVSETDEFTKIATVTGKNTYLDPLDDREKVYYYKMRVVSKKGEYSPFSAVVPTVEVSLTLSKTSLNMRPHGTHTLTADYVGFGELIWSSSNPDVAVVVNGKVICRTVGTTVIMVTDGKVSANCTVTVTEAELRTLQFLTERDTPVYQGETYQMEYHYAGTGELTWISHNPDVLTVNETGLVTGISVGSGVVEVTDGTNRARTILQIKDPVNKVEKLLVNEDHFLYDGVTKVKGDYLEPKVMTQPNPQSHDITYTSSDPGVVSVEWYERQSISADTISTWLILRFNYQGTAVVTITSEDRAVSESYTIHVKEDYDCNPGKEKLTPEEFAYYATQVGVEMGHQKSEVLSGYLYAHYDEKDLTWKNAVGFGTGTAHRVYGYFDNDYNYRPMLITYAGWCEDHQQHLFYTGY